MNRWIGVGVVAMVVNTFGCGEATPTTVDTKIGAKAKVEAMKKLANALAANPGGLEAADAFEEFRNAPMNPKDHPDESREILDVYKSRIQGKYASDIAQQLQVEMTAFRVAAGVGK